MSTRVPPARTARLWLSRRLAAELCREVWEPREQFASRDLGSSHGLGFRVSVHESTIPLALYFVT